MKSAKPLLVLLLVGIVLTAGCTQNQGPQNNAPTNQNPPVVTPPANTTPLADPLSESDLAVPTPEAPIGDDLSDLGDLGAPIDETDLQ